MNDINLKNKQTGICNLIKKMEIADKLEQTLLKETTIVEEFLCSLRRINAHNDHLVQEIHTMGAQFHEQISALKLKTEKHQKRYYDYSCKVKTLQ